MMDLWGPLLGVVSALLTALLGLVTWRYQQEKLRREATERQLSDKKYTTYTALLDLLVDLSLLTLTTTPQSQAAFYVSLARVNKDMLMYASEEVYNLYRRLLGNLAIMNAETLSAAEKLVPSFKLPPVADEAKHAARDAFPLTAQALLLAIRRDMGHPHTAVTAKETSILMVPELFKFIYERHHPPLPEASNRQAP